MIMIIMIIIIIIIIIIPRHSQPNPIKRRWQLNRRNINRRIRQLIYHIISQRIRPQCQLLVLLLLHQRPRHQSSRAIYNPIRRARAQRECRRRVAVITENSRFAVGGIQTMGIWIVHT